MIMNLHDKYKKYRPLVKRAIDVSVASVGLFFSLPIVTVAGIVIRIKEGEDPSFDQDRIGLNGEVFKVHKLKTIYNGKQNGLSHFLRRSKIDELPQLWNVFKGEMSLVGPRPLMTKTKIAHDPVRQSVLPGITGYAQINGGNDLTDDQKLRKDRAYVRREGGLRTDLSMLFGTFASVISGSDSASALNKNEVFIDDTASKVHLKPQTKKHPPKLEREALEI